MLYFLCNYINIPSLLKGGGDMVIEIDLLQPITETIVIDLGVMIITIKPMRRKRISVQKD
jgi:hypothetical protein